VLLADEPTSELDEGNRGLVLRELRAEADRGGVVVVATHDPAVVEVCDRHYVLDEGRLVDHVEAVHLEARRPLPAAVPAGIHVEPEPPAEVAEVAEPDPGPGTPDREPGRHAGPWSAEAEAGSRPDRERRDDSPFRRPTGPA
jgi:putative ABC transport system ATP-binding protein